MTMKKICADVRACCPNRRMRSERGPLSPRVSDLMEIRAFGSPRVRADMAVRAPGVAAALAAALLLALLTGCTVPISADQSSPRP